MIALLLAVLPQAAVQEESYVVDFLTPPEGEVLEVGGLDFFSDGRLAVSTRRGQVWIVENPLAEDPADARFSLFAEGLFEGLGLAIVEDELYVLQRTELSRLRDVDGDGLCDDVECISDDWGYSGNYHEFAFGLPVDSEGNFYVSLNLGFFNPEWWHGRSRVPDRGWLLSVSPTGETRPFAFGMRSPCGLGFDSQGNLFYTDNQGDWMPACPIFHAQYGRFYGHPAALNWTQAYLESQTTASDTIPPERYRERAAAWIPYEWSRSTGSLVPDDTGGRFGPFEGQLMVSELTNGRLLRASLERVRGEFQGAVFPMLTGLGSVVRVRFAPDGTLFTGLTNRGWGGVAPGAGIGRVRFTGVTPFALEHVSLSDSGLWIDLTEPADPESVPTRDEVQLVDYDYDYWWEYGSPERDRTQLEVSDVRLERDGLRLWVGCPDLTPGRVLRGLVPKLRSTTGRELLSGEFAYTVNQVPGRKISRERVAKTVPPPPARETGEEGWLRLTYGDAFDAWESEGWELCDAQVDPADPRRFATSPGVAALTNTGSDAPSDYLSRFEFGDVRLRLALMLAEGGVFEVLFADRYPLRLEVERDALPVGVWQELDVTFRGARLSPEGVLLEPARIERCELEGALLFEELALAPVEGAGEGSRGRLRLHGDLGPVAVGNLRLLSLDAKESAGDEATSLLPEAEDLTPWRLAGPPSFELDDEVLIGSGEPSVLLLEGALPEHFDLTLRAKVSDGGRSSLLLRAEETAAGVSGYELVLNSSFPDPLKTGSLAGLAPVRTHLVAPDTWFQLALHGEEVGEGFSLRVELNGVLISDVVDTQRLHQGSGLALVQHHEGSVVEVSELRVSERTR